MSFVNSYFAILSGLVFNAPSQAVKQTILSKLGESSNWAMPLNWLLSGLPKGWSCCCLSRNPMSLLTLFALRSRSSKCSESVCYKQNVVFAGLLISYHCCYAVVRKFYS